MEAPLCAERALCSVLRNIPLRYYDIGGGTSILRTGRITALCTTRSVLKGPKVVRFKPHRNSRSEKRKTHRKGVFSFLVAEVGFDVIVKKIKCEQSEVLFAARDFTLR